MPPKKATKHHGDKHYHHTKDLRHAYEHLGRIEALQRANGGPFAGVAVLVSLAEEGIVQGAFRNAADLLRAAEHLSFAAMYQRSDHMSLVTDALLTEIEEELDRLEEKAEEHWDAKAALPATIAIYEKAVVDFSMARTEDAYREALELIRAAEALAHVRLPQKAKKHEPKRVAARSNVRELAAS